MNFVARIFEKFYIASIFNLTMFALPVTRNPAASQNILDFRVRELVKLADIAMS